MVHFKKQPLLCPCPASATPPTPTLQSRPSLATILSWSRARNSCDLLKLNTSFYLFHYFHTLFYFRLDMPSLTTTTAQGRTYQFDWLFFKRFYHLHQIFFPGIKNVLIFIVLVATSSAGLELSFRRYLSCS